MKRRDILAAGVAVTAAPFGAIAARAPAGAILLLNAEWRVEIDPQTLAIAVQPTDAARTIVSRGVSGHIAGDVQHDDASASWNWDGYRFACTLAGPDLSITVTATAPGDLQLLDQPSEAMGKGLTLPITEGYYVARGDETWRTYLAEHHNSLASSEDLSVPMWGMDHGDRTLHWLLTNPFNNEVSFAAEADGLAMKLSHNFTRLSPSTPMTMMLHLGAGDLLAGSRRYRKHLIDSGAYRSLADKIGKTPSGEKLIGATHLYLWGTGLIAAKDVRDWPGFMTRLRGPSAIARRVRGKLDAEGLEAIAGPASAPYQRHAILRAFNTALTDLAREDWQKEEVDSQVLIAAYPALRQAVIAEFGAVLTADPATWGGGFSAATFDTLKAAKLDRLWIGLGEGWDGGLWRPETIRAGTQLGYLIGPYDSYETAIPPGVRPDWSTAQLGRTAYDQCAIINADGKARAGFQQTGHYTNTLCVTPILKDRVPAIAKASGFNSWFLDVYATGMVFDDYRPGRESTMAQQAAAHVAACRFVSEELQIPAGSEGGNAVGAPGVLFAHGIATPLFGWGDPDLRKNASSPFYFGNWYPPESPGVFFKPVPLKEPYRSLYFDPAKRLPLYQGVFHGSVLSTHQWGFDQLKLSNATASRSLIQQLYNYPPLFHLSAETLTARLPVIAAHDAFFRPMHQRLAHRTMEGFDWLSDDRLIQRTRFSDGTALVANFAGIARTADGILLPPNSVTAIIDGRPDRVFTA